MLESALRQLCNPFLGKRSSHFLSSYSRNLQFYSLTFIARSLEGPGSDFSSAFSMELAFQGTRVHLSVKHLHSNPCSFFAFSSTVSHLTSTECTPTCLLLS